MQETQAMTRDRQINFRVSEEEAACFERVATHVGLPVGAMIRRLVREKDEALAPHLTVAHREALSAVGPAGVGLLHDGIASNMREMKLKTKGLPETLHDLCRWGLLRRDEQGFFYRTKLAVKGGAR